MSVTGRLMMTRMGLHSVGTLCALYVSVWLWTGAAMWLRVIAYAGAWLMCAGAYFVVLYLWQHALDAFDERVRALVRDELTDEELRRYQRRLRFIGRWHDGKTLR